MLTLALNILDIVQNSIRAKASEIVIDISESIKNDLLEIKVSDNGKGMPEELLSKVTDPFVTTRTTRKIGMGLPLFKYQANLAGGDLSILSGEGRGTTVNVTFALGHVDRQPLGDIAGVMTILMSANPELVSFTATKTDTGNIGFLQWKPKNILVFRILTTAISCPT
jgi:K+-sensing histidine kinase KdpD